MTSILLKQLPFNFNEWLEKHSQAVFITSITLLMFTSLSGLLVTVSLFFTESSVGLPYVEGVQNFVLNNMLWLLILLGIGFLGMMTSLKPVLESYYARQMTPAAPTQPEELFDAIALDKLAQAYLRQGEYSKALPLVEQALQLRQQTLGRQHPDTATSLNNLAYLYHLQGKYDKALPLYEQALQIRKQVLGQQHPSYATSLNNLALLYDSQGEYDKALPLFEQALQIREQVLGKQHPSYAASLNNLAGLYNSQGEYDKALPLYEQALQITKQVLGQQHPDYAQSLNNLAGLYYSQDKYDKALPLYKQAIEILVKVLGEQHPDTKKVKHSYQSLLQQLGNSKLPETIPKAAAPVLNRNAPCPCGSGQRYKHCCGQAV